MSTPKEKKAGGVAIFIKKDIPYTLVNELQTCNKSIETIAIKTKIDNKNVSYNVNFHACKQFSCNCIKSNL